MADFDKATAVHGGNGRYEVDIDPEWTVGGNPHGGYLLALLVRAAIAELADEAHLCPLSSSALYLSPPSVGPATAVVEILRRGRIASQLRARLVQPGPDGAQRTHVEAVLVLGQLDPDAQPRWVDVAAPEFSAPRLCPVSPVVAPGSDFRVAMLDQVELRIDPAGADREGDVRGWLRFADDTPFDPVSLLFVADSLPPSIMSLGTVGWVPTLELTVYVRAVPAPGPLRVRQHARLLVGDLVDQVCEVWDSTGRVVAQATQLAAVRMRS